ncbi:MAG: protein kinase [Chloroflexi bacterium]|nr:protein kinase [Chloroflexota bacterium]
MEWADLDNQIAGNFDKSELRNLCFDLNVNYENLSGDTLQNKAGALIRYCRRHGLLSELMAQCRKLRPHVAWPDGGSDALTTGSQIQHAPSLLADYELILAERFVISDLENDLIGRGSMGDVYRGYDAQTGTAVAVKALKSDIVSGNPQLVERFVREGEALRQLNHPNIVKMLAAIEEADRHYLVMEYVSGGSLRDLLDDQNQLPLHRVLQIGLELADALTRAHHLNIIHRDLKPANVLLADDGTPRLTDFGVAHIGDRPRLTQSGALVGTLDYLSPEICNGEKQDARSDIWSFGVVLFEMLAGKRPFAAPSLAATLTAILTQPTPDIVQFRPDTAGALAELIRRMLEKELRQRTPSARLVGAELEAIVQGRETKSQAWRTESREDSASPSSELSASLTPERRNQLILLEKVKNFWIRGVLEKLEEDTPLIDLAWRRCDEQIDHPWSGMLDMTAYGDDSDSTHGDTLNTFIKADRSLLILGAPGSGKTTTLLKLARALIHLAEQDTSQPIPVILNLISWAEEKRPLADWIVEELTTKYQIPRQMGQPWLADNNLLFLLDALDGVPAKQRAECVAAVNQFREAFGLTGIIIGSRAEAYESIGAQLKLGGSIQLQPLTPTQVDAYLTAAGPQLTALRAALQRDEGYAELQKMAQSPLMLNVMSRAYRHVDQVERDSQSGLAQDKDDLTGGQVDAIARHQHLLEAYVQRMFQRHRNEDAFSPMQMRQWLGWLAQKMFQHNQAVFLIEQLQPSWLDTQIGRWVYLLGTHALAGLIVGIMTWLVSLLNQIQIVSAYNNLLTLLGLNLFLGLLICLLDGVLLIVRPSEQAETTGANSRRGWLKGIIIGIVAGGIAAAVLALIGDESQNAVSYAFWIGAFFVFAARDNGLSLRNQIRPTEALRWSWPEAIRGVAPGFIVGAVFTVASFLNMEELNWGPLATMLIPWMLAFFLFGGLRGKRVETTSRPNQGIWLSARNGATAALLLGTLFGGYFLLLGIIYGVYRATWVMGLLLALGGLFGFAGSVFEHFLVRFLLWRKERIPWQIARFLDTAVDHIFLYRVGGGYIFVNRALQAYFANL